MNTRMLVPVTARLAGEMEKTQELIREMSGITQLINDRHHYVDAAQRLEALVMAALSAASSITPTARNVQAFAKFDMGAQTMLAREITNAVGYLRDVASELLAEGEFSQYSREDTDRVFAHLETLHQILEGAILTQAKINLAEIAATGTRPLIETANELAAARWGEPAVEECHSYRLDPFAQED
jgi:hypothetical protein